MDLCREHDFDPEKSVLLTRVDPGTTLNDVRKAFGHIDDVKKIKWIGDKFPGELLCEFQEVATPFVVEEEQLNGSEQYVWGVVPLDSRQFKDVQHPPSISTPIQSGSVQTLDDMADQLLVQIENLAQMHCVNLSDLSQQVVNKLAHKTDNVDQGPITSTPAAILFVDARPRVMSAEASMPVSKVSFANQDDSPPIKKNIGNETPVTFTIPQDVQRVVVEHVVKHDPEYQGHHLSPPKLRVFSGHCPKPNGEVDFTTWQLYVKQLLPDTSLTERHKRRHILDSLLPPALTVALGAGTNAPPEVYVLELEKAYGSVTGGDELYIQFIETHQNRGEKPSDYLRRLHALLLEVIEKKGVIGKQSDTLLLKQFIRGCWDEALITQLRLKELLTEQSPSELSYSSILFKLRSYEHEKQLKENRMNLHLNAPPKRAQSHVHVAVNQGSIASSEGVQNNEVLMRRIKELEAEVVKAKNQTSATVNQQGFDQLQASATKKRGKEVKLSRPVAQPKQLPISGFCYRCGEDSHYLQHCTNPVNAALVQQKLVQRHEQRGSPNKMMMPTTHLNLA